MVVINNSYSGVNGLATDAYIRNLNDFRVGVELAVLPVINFLIAQSKTKDFIIPTLLFEKERSYFKFLAERYHKQPIVFNTKYSSEDIVFRLLVSAIGKSRKRVSYSLNDLIDVLHEFGDHLTKTKFHKNIIHTVVIACESFYKKIPSRFSKQINLKTNPLKPVKVKYSSVLKHSSPLNLYLSVLSNLKKVVDLEILKLYDFLFEFGFKEIKSTALLEIIDDVIKLGQTEYVKKGIRYKAKNLLTENNTISILPTIMNPTVQDRMVEEWCSNIRRAIELKTLLSVDLKILLEQKPEVKKVLDFFPELKFL